MRERTQIQEAPADDTLALVKQMQSLLFFNGMWHARASESDAFHKHEDPRGAMRLALGLDKLEEENHAIRRERKAIDPPPGRVLDSHKSRRQRSLLDDE